jgi:hypothetical protein
MSLNEQYIVYMSKLSLTQIIHLVEPKGFYLMIVYNTQNRWVCGLNTFQKLNLYPSSGVGREFHTLLGHLDQ